MLPTATVADFLAIFLGSMVLTPHGRRVSSYNLYLNPIEQIIENKNLRFLEKRSFFLHHGGEARLCKLFSKMSARARALGEAVVGIKPGILNRDVVIMFPCGVENTNLRFLEKA
jgi:hypothetical protein